MRQIFWIKWDELKDWVNTWPHISAKKCHEHSTFSQNNVQGQLENNHRVLYGNFKIIIWNNFRVPNYRPCIYYPKFTFGFHFYVWSASKQRKMCRNRKFKRFNPNHRNIPYDLLQISENWWILGPSHFHVSTWRSQIIRDASQPSKIFIKAFQIRAIF